MIFHVAVRGSGIPLREIWDFCQWINYWNNEDTESKDIVFNKNRVIVEGLIECDQKEDEDCFPDAERFDSLKAFFAKHPRVKILFDLTLNPAKPAYKGIPDGVIIQDMHGARAWIIYSVVFRRGEALNSGRVLFLLALDQMHDDLFLLDLDGNILELNEKAVQTIGLPKEKILGQSCWDLVTDFSSIRERDEETSPFKFTVRTGRGTEGILPTIDKDNKLHFYRISSYPIRNGKGELTHVIIWRRDVTSSSFKEHEDFTLEIQKVLSEFADYTAHELLNPLVPLAGFNKKLLLLPELSEDQREKLEGIRESALRIEKISKTIKEIARFPKAKTGECDVRQVLDSVLNGFSETGNAQASPNLATLKKQTTFTFDFEASLPKVGCHEDTLSEILKQILTNSLEAMPDGGHIHIKGEGAWRFICVIIEDNGRGILEEYMPLIYDPFFSTKIDPISGKAQGSGLGLPIVRHLMREIRGEHTVESFPGKGTKVTLYFPLVLATQDVVGNLGLLDRKLPRKPLRKSASDLSSSQSGSEDPTLANFASGERPLPAQSNRPFRGIKPTPFYKRHGKLRRVNRIRRLFRRF